MALVKEELAIGGYCVMAKRAMVSLCLILGACSANGSGIGTTGSPGDAGAGTSGQTDVPVGAGGSAPGTGGQGGTKVSGGGAGGGGGIGGRITNQGGTGGQVVTPTGGTQAGCIPGASALCYCPNAQQGAQICASDGTFGACNCETSSTGGSIGAGGAVMSTGGAVGTGGTTTIPDASVPQDAPCGGLNEACCASIQPQTGNPCIAAGTTCYAEVSGVLRATTISGTCVACGAQNQAACWTDYITGMTYTCQAGLVVTSVDVYGRTCTVPDASVPDTRPPTSDAYIPKPDVYVAPPDTKPASTCGGNGQPCCVPDPSKWGTCNSVFADCTGTKNTNATCVGCGGPQQLTCITAGCQSGLLPLYCGEGTYSLGTPYAILCGDTGTGIKVQGTFCVNCPAADLGTDGQCEPRSYLCGAVNELPCP